MQNLQELRKQVRDIIKETALINELQRNPSLNDDINEYFKRVEFSLDGNPVLSKVAIDELKRECASALRMKIYQLETGKYNYADFYVIKLSDFFLQILKGKDGKPGKMKITFSDTEANKTSVFKDFATSFVVFIYHNTLFKFFPYNENLHTDAMLEKQAKMFIESPKFEETFGSKYQRAKFTGEIVVRTIDSPSFVYTEYFNQKSSAKSQERTKPFDIQKKKSYRKNSPLNHEKFGKGIIASVKKAPKYGENAYIVTADFPGFGTKQIMVKTKQDEEMVADK